jgi:competence protein ComEA
VPVLRLTRRTALVLAAAALAVVFGAAELFRPGAKPTVSVQSSVIPHGASSASPGASAGTAVVVDVTGAVRRPGLYRLRRGARIADAIARAGGATKSADTALVNLAAPLADGQQVVMPRRDGKGSAVSGSGASGPGSSTPAPIDLNTATADELDALPGVGPVTARKIVAYREEHGPFTSLSQLDAIPGIGPARIADLRGLVVQG